MIKASDAIAYGRSLLGTPYGSGTGQLDCINFVKKIIRDCPGGDKRYTDAHVPALWASYTASKKYRHLTARQESIDGAVPGMLAFKGQPIGSGGQPSHVGLVATASTVLHASSAKGEVVETDLFNGQWSLLGTSSMIEPDTDTAAEPETDDRYTCTYTAQVIALTNNKPVRLRTGPSTDDSVITMVPVGTVVEVLTVHDDWSFIDTGRQKGYMMSKFLQEICTAEEPKTAEDGYTWMNDPYLISDTGAQIHLCGQWRLAID